MAFGYSSLPDALLAGTWRRNLPLPARDDDLFCAQNGRMLGNRRNNLCVLVSCGKPMRHKLFIVVVVSLCYLTIAFMIGLTIFFLTGTYKGIISTI